MAFPFALVRRENAFAYSMHKGKFAKDHAVARRSAIALTGKQRFVEGVLHFQTTDGFWLSDRFVSRVDGVKHMPKWANDGERWIDVSITKQVLMAYDGTKPAYVTLVSTGEAGLSNPETTKSTVQGIFRIHTKHLTTTMSSNVVGEEFELKDIPYVSTSRTATRCTRPTGTTTSARREATAASTSPPRTRGGSSSGPSRSCPRGGTGCARRSAAASSSSTPDGSGTGRPRGDFVA